METKICGKCQEEKALTFFSKANKKPSGYQSYCKGCAHPHRAQWARDNTDKTRGYKLKYSYGLTPEEFLALVLAQNGACKLCKKVFAGTPNIDHDHKCCGPIKACKKCVRGLLCTKCNIFVGHFENYHFMEEVKEYLGMPTKDEKDDKDD